MIKHYITLLIISIFMIGAVIYGFLSGGSPWEARNQKFDQIRITNLREIKYSIQTYFGTNRNLPQNLTQIKETLYGQKAITDPETGIEYEYLSKDQSTYQLCANFSSNPPTTTNDSKAFYTSSYNDEFTKYQKGRYCFDLNATGYSNTYSPAPTYYQQSFYPSPSPSSSSLNLSPATTCVTLGTQLVQNQNGETEVGCDAEVNGSILLAKSYCQSQKTLIKEPLKVDAYNRANRYYATLKGVEKGDTVEVIVYSSDNKQVKCIPDIKT